MGLLPAVLAPFDFSLSFLCMPVPIEFAPVRVGVAGLGRAGMFHVERIGLRDDLRVVALYDDCLAASERAKAAAPQAANWRALLANDEIELVLVATPPALHAELTIEALSAGKHVLVETPMCLNLAEADAVIAAARRSNRLVSVAHLRRWDDDFRTALQTIVGGELGRPRTIKFINWHYNPYPLQQAGAAPPLPPLSGVANSLDAVSWRDNAATGGGVLWEFGIHYFDQLLQLAGRGPESVYARLSSGSAGRADDAFLAVVNFPGGLSAQIEVDRAAAAPLDTGWTIAGSLGSYAGLTQYTPNSDGEVVDLPLLPLADADDFYAMLARHLRQGGPNPATADEARRAIALIEATRRSARCGEVVTVEI